MTDTLGWRLTAPLRQLNALRRGEAVPQRARISSREMTDWAGAIPARTRSLDSRSATSERRDSSIRRSTASWRALCCASSNSCAMCSTRLRLEPLEHRVAVPRVQQRASASDHGASRCQTTPTPKNTGTTTSRRRSRSATKSSTAVSTPLREPPSLRGRPRVRQPAVAQPRVAGEQAAACSPATGWRASARDRAGVVVVVAPAVRPADVVEEQQRQRGAAAPARRSGAAPRGP